MKLLLKRSVRDLGGGKETTFLNRSHSYCLSLPFCLDWYNRSITPRVHSGVTRRTECSYTTDRPRPLNKCVKPLRGVGKVRLTLTYPTPESRQWFNIHVLCSTLSMA